MICNECIKHCLCANCVLNPFYCKNTPRPCAGADCDICESFDMNVDLFCNKRLTIEEVNAKIESERKGDK